MSMIQEIISQMYVDPELLAQLGEEQQQILFRRMREEQVRRWREKEAKLDKISRKTRGRKINFLLGKDGNPWVWVMGEHKADLQYNELVRRQEMEELEKEKLSELQDRKEAEELAKLETRGILSLAKQFGEVHSPRRQNSRGRTNEPYGSPLLEENANPSPQVKTTFLTVHQPGVVRTESQINVTDSPFQESQSMIEQDKKEEEQRQKKKMLVRKASIIGANVEEQHKFEKERTEEVFNSLRRVRSIGKKRAADMAKKVESCWQESEKKAKEYERFRTNSFKKAREITTTRPNIPETILDDIPNEKKVEIIRRMSISSHQRQRKKPVRQAPPRPLVKRSSVFELGTVPKSSAHVTVWFNTNEAPKGTGKERDGSISVWFYGRLTRDASVRALDQKPVGSFLVRLSNKIWGYAITVKTYTDCKHFLVDASSGKYCFVGPKQQKFDLLTELIKFYRVNPITWSGQEVLLIPVAQEEVNMALYRGLYTEEEDVVDEVIRISISGNNEFTGSTL